MIYEMSFGNGGTSVDPNRYYYIFQFNPTGTNASLYNPTFTKVVDDRSTSNTDPVRNKIETRHVSGTNYTDIVVTCLLDYGEPEGQDAFDTATDADNPYVFDELGLKSYNPGRTGRLITHVIFHRTKKFKQISSKLIIQCVYKVCSGV